MAAAACQLYSRHLRVFQWVSHMVSARNHIRTHVLQEFCGLRAVCAAQHICRRGHALFVQSVYAAVSAEGMGYTLRGTRYRRSQSPACRGDCEQSIAQLQHQRTFIVSCAQRERWCLLGAWRSAVGHTAVSCCWAGQAGTVLKSVTGQAVQAAYGSHEVVLLSQPFAPKTSVGRLGSFCSSADKGLRSQICAHTGSQSSRWLLVSQTHLILNRSRRPGKQYSQSESQM